MIRTIVLSLLFLLFSINTEDSFKQEQQEFPRVRKAYEEKETTVMELLSKNGIDSERLRIYLRAFKQEQKLELWGKNNADLSYKFINEYEICNTSGELGPKRKQGDYQIPEGFYHIDRFNPFSNYYLSLGINYPNRSDRILGEKGNLGGDIFIHGDCVTIGCLPMTDDKIKEIYIFCVEAKNNGQDKIPVTIFPARLTDSNFEELTSRPGLNSDNILLWSELKEAYDSFGKNNQLPKIVFKDNGLHQVGE